MANEAYISGKNLDKYVCGNCGKSGVKLWREANTFVPDLLCVHCACQEEGKTDNVDANGFRLTKAGNYEYKTDQIGGYVPAVPFEEGNGYWWYTSAPQVAVEWWCNLPTR